MGSFLTALRGTEHVSISVDGRILTLESGAHKAKINGYDVEDFPIIPSSTEQNMMELSLSQLKNSISKVLNFTSKTETRVELTGVFLTFDEKSVCSVATDSFRLGEMCVPLESLIMNRGATNSLTSNERQIILPQQLCAYINKLSDEHEIVQCSVEENHLFLVCDDLYITARLIDGAYPDYKQIIPTSSVTNIIIKKDALLEAMKITTVFTGRDSGEIHFDISDNTLKITTRQQEVGENTTELQVELEGDAQNIVLNPRFVIDGVGKIDAENVNIAINGNAAPVVFRGYTDGKIDENYTHIVMPVKSA